MEFNSLENDFGGSAGSLFVAFYGPSERWNRGGVARVTIQKTSVGYEYKELPVVDIPKLSDLTFGKDGSLYLAQHGISDYWYNPTEVKTGGFYKLIHDPSREGKHLTKREIKEESFPEASLEKGRELFALRACSACHSIDGETDLIGPNLNGVGREFSQEELLEEINAPSNRIKASMIATKITLNDGKVLLGRVVYSDADQISIMLVGNHTVQVKKSDIEKKPRKS
ncbi:c-type cytochrome [Algoriphagus boritolerans]|uniref:c-type cytochrome n=1 Tax=Algoriphagus boritolerans TaxID=308111 RepID=UPI002FCE45D2